MKNYQFDIISSIRLHEGIFFPLMRLRQHWQHTLVPPLVTSATQIVIEGFFRCANTFAMRAFLNAQAPNKVKIANHTHAPASIHRAVRLGIPTLVLIRRPDEVAISHVLKHPHLSLKQSLVWYYKYYRSISHLSEGFVLADFHEVSTNYGEVIHKVNRYFNTEFIPFEHIDENVSAVLKRILQTDNRLEPGQETKVSVPSGVKDQAKRVLRMEIQSVELRSSLEKAMDIYQSLNDLSDYRVPI